MKRDECLREIWVCCETEGGCLTRNSRELLGKARELADEAGYHVYALLFGDAGRAVAQSTVFFGADAVHTFFFTTAADETTQAQAVAEHMKAGRPWAFLFPATGHGRTLAAMLSVRLKTGLTADCTMLSVEGGFLKQTRPAFGGSMMAEVFCCHSFPQMATVRSGVFPLPSENWKRRGIFSESIIKTDAEIMRLMKKNRQNCRGKSLNEAEIIFAGGMGLGTAVGFRLLEQVAELFDGVVGASRAAVNAGLAPYACQVGQSGRAVRPKLYIACGISGAVQHMAGVQGAGTIIAVNCDRKAPIFRCADIGICGDCRTFLEELLQAGKSSLKR